MMKFLEVYGSAETGPTTFNTVADRKIGTVGKPINEAFPY
jgi:hypothetical protein